MKSMISFYVRWASSTVFGLLHQQKFCPHWDRALSALIDRHWRDASLEHDAVLQLGGQDIWVANPFYSYGHAYSGGLPYRRPSLRTMHALDCIVSALAAAEEQKNRDKYIDVLDRMERGE